MIALPPDEFSRPVPPMPTEWQAVRYFMLADGGLAVVGTDVDLAGAWARSHAAAKAWPSSRTDLERPRRLAKNAAAQCWSLGASGWQREAAFALETPFPLFDRFADGSWLVAPSRSEAGALAARRFGPDGTVQRRFTLGDGIEHVAVDASDRIWVGWFDEGVFGNDGWRVEGREWPPSANGVACFSGDGTLLNAPAWPFDVVPGADCYALNATGSGVWVCSYPDFPLARFVPGKPVRWWRGGLAGTRAIAVAGDHALFVGGYGARANQLALLALPGRGRGEAMQVRRSWTLPLRRRVEPTEYAVWEEPDLLAGRGDTIHLVDAGTWHRWRVGDLRDLVDRKGEHG